MRVVIDARSPLQKSETSSFASLALDLLERFLRNLNPEIFAAYTVNRSKT
jgi:hypothetical protein